jgi:uncharacterized protein
MLFEWDGEKNLANTEKHGISFYQATDLFDNPHIEEFDSKHSDKEDRYLSIGQVNDLFLVVVFTERFNDNGEKIVRIISARKANKEEIKEFFRRI